jgi:sugar O-acyltransferase (sialic acid O-acetyltransferase NeuD family)
MKAFLLGGGGHATAVYEVIMAGSQIDIVAVVDRPGFVKEALSHLVKFSSLEQAITEMPAVEAVVIGYGQIGSPDLRKGAFDECMCRSMKLPIVVSPTAYVAKDATIGDGCCIMHGAVVGAGVLIGNNCIINSKALLEHGARVGSHSHISTGSILNGEATVGQECFLGSGSLVLQGVSIGDKSIIAAGGLVRKDLLPSTKFLGGR